MSPREKAIADVKTGDVVFGLGSGGEPKLLFVYKVHHDGFSARHITTQAIYRFGSNGKTRLYADGGQVTIMSTAQLAKEQYEVAIGLDRKFAARPEYPDTILTEAEIQLLLTNQTFFEANLLPSDQ